MNKTTIIIAAGVSAIVALLIWMFMYEYRPTVQGCVQRINRITHSVDFGCPGSAWRPIGEGSPVALTPFTGRLDTE